MSAHLSTRFSCPHCGSHDVGRDATARWSDEAGAWVLSDVQDCAFCNECGEQDIALVHSGPAPRGWDKIEGGAL